MAFEKQLQQKSLNICNEQPEGMSFSLVSGISSIANNEYISVTNNILSHGLLALSQTICFSLMIFSLVVKVCPPKHLLLVYEKNQGRVTLVHCTS